MLEDCIFFLIVHVYGIGQYLEERRREGNESALFLFSPFWRRNERVTCLFDVFPLVQSGRIADDGGKKQPAPSAGP